VDASLPKSNRAAGMHAQGERLTFAPLPGRIQIAILFTVLVVLLFLILMPPLPQDQSYHAFADRCTLLGIPNFWDVVSNLPFAVVGLIGLLTFHDFAARIVFLGIFATAFGSAYYHLRELPELNHASALVQDAVRVWYGRRQEICRTVFATVRFWSSC